MNRKVVIGHEKRLGGYLISWHTPNSFGIRKWKCVVIISFVGAINTEFEYQLRLVGNSDIFVLVGWITMIRAPEFFG